MTHQYSPETAIQARLSQELTARGLVPTDAVWSPLTGGRTNRIWHVKGTGQNLAVKLYPEDAQTPVFRNDGVAEAGVLRALAGTGIAPELVALTDTASGSCVIYHHVAGDMWRGNPRPVAVLLAQVHGMHPEIGLPEAPTCSDSLQAQTLEMLASCEPEAAEDLRKLEPSGGVGPPHRLSLIHGDVVPGNIVMAAHGPCLIDWQCPALGDPCVDIAMFLSPAMQSLYSGRLLDAAAQAAFLNSYGCAEVANRYHRLAPWFHWRMAAYCQWKSERGAADYAAARSLEIAALRAVTRDYT